MNYKKISQISLIFFIALAITSPSFSFAIGNADAQAQRDAKKEEIQANRIEKTCTQLSSQADQIQARLTERISQLTQKRTELEAKIQQQITERTTTRTTKRAEIDAKRLTSWESLRANAETPEQKAAVEKFITAIQNAVKIKRASIDKIIADFRAGLKAEKSERKTTTDTALNDYKSSVSSLISQVKADCAAGKDAKTIRETFRNGVKEVKEAFKNSRKSPEKFRDDVTPLKETKKAELKAVIDNFQASIEAAKAELRAAFPKTTETTTTETE